MGTRHITAVWLNDDWKVAQYGQWDGYPEGQGITILETLHAYPREQIRSACENCTFLSKEELDAAYKPYSSGEWMTMDQAKAFKASEWGHLSRDTGGEILEHIVKANGLPLVNQIDFIGDGLFCEWAYVVDFDKGTFEVYRGFNQDPDKVADRFKDMKSPNYEGNSGSYYPPQLAGTFQLNSLPDRETFLAILEPAHEAV